LALYSEDFSNAAWIKFNATITANDAISPDGTQNADKVVFSGTNHYFYQQTSFVGQATASIYVKGTAGQTISIDNTQTITEPLITLTGEWQRVILTSTTSGAAVQGLAISTFQSATARTIYVWGGQIE
jgi:predicted transcriptional regulator